MVIRYTSIKVKSDLFTDDVLNDEAVAGDAGDNFGRAGDVQIKVAHILPENCFQILDS